jgi:hypothetical protein
MAPSQGLNIETWSWVADWSSDKELDICKLVYVVGRPEILLVLQRPSSAKTCRSTILISTNSK